MNPMQPISQELQELRDNIKNTDQYVAAAYAALQSNGASLPEKCNAANLAGVIESSAAGEGDGTDWGTLYCNAYKNGVALAGPGDFNALSDMSGSSTPIVFSFGNIQKDTVTGFSFGRYGTIAGNYFLSNMPGLTRLEYTEQLVWCGDSAFSGTPLKFLSLPNLLGVGNNFLSGAASFVGPLELPKIRKIGHSFLARILKFKGPLILSRTIQEIDFTSFMEDIDAFTGPLIIETDVIPTGTGLEEVLSAVGTTSAAYKTGVTISGPGATTWKAALPDRTSSPYRKLILDPEWS